MMRRVLFLSLAILLTIKLSIPLFDSSPYNIQEDRYGVPIVDYEWLMGRYIGEKRYPVTIAASANMYYLSYREEGNTRDYEKFLNNVEWLYRNRVEIKDFVVWPADFEYPFYGCERGWASAMAQGNALKAFLRAHELTGDEEYLQLTVKILNSYKTEIRDGGVLYVDPDDGGYWYAEYACGEPPRVLNGFWFALDGLHYYYTHTGDEDALELYGSGVEELLRHLPEFDAGDWSYYDLEGYPSDANYHSLHVAIMEDLYEQTGTTTFLEYHEKWEAYDYGKGRFYPLVMKNLIHKFAL